ncbi:MAG: CHAP domain-containing protein [Bacteroidia bacterium]
MRYLLVVLIFSVSFAAKAQTKTVQQKIVAFCDASKDKKVGKGECWDLAKEALDTAGAKWEAPFGFGTELKKKNKVQPGDIIQFENVRIEYPDGSWKELPHHTAIVYKIISPGKFTVAEQNVNGKRYVVFSELDLNYIKKGKYTIYRPA